MTTVTTTNLAWSASWFQGAVSSSDDDSQTPMKHGSAVVSKTSENTASASLSDDTKKDDPSAASLLSEASSYLNLQSTRISGAKGAIESIYGALGKVISSSSTSDEQKWAAYVTSDEMRSEIETHGGQDANGVTLSFDAETEDTPFMKTINAGLEDISKRKLVYDDNQRVSIPLERSLLYLQQREEQAHEEEMWGSSSLSINIQETTIHTESGDQTSFAIASDYSGQEDFPSADSSLTLRDSVQDVDTSKPYNFTPSGNTTGITGSFDSARSLAGQLDKEIVDQLFAIPSASEATSKNTKTNHSTGLNIAA